MRSFDVNELKNEVLGRASTGFEELDWIYGFSTDFTGTSWGIPEKTISLWAGSKGTGKSRICIEVARKMANNGWKILYFQNEVPLSTFAGWVKRRGIINSNFRISDESNLKGMVDIITMDRPHIVIVDSINMLEEYRSGTKTDIQRIIDGYDGIPGFRTLCKELGIHVIFIAQLNQDNTVKGSTTLGHLADIEIYIKKDKNGYVGVSVGEKHRYGRTGKNFCTWWEHEEEGVKCISRNRLIDEKWCECKGIVFPSIKEEVVAPRKENLWKKILGIK